MLQSFQVHPSPSTPWGFFTSKSMRDGHQLDKLGDQSGLISPGFNNNDDNKNNNTDNDSSSSNNSSNKNGNVNGSGNYTNGDFASAGLASINYLGSVRHAQVAAYFGQQQQQLDQPHTQQDTLSKSPKRATISLLGAERELGCFLTDIFESEAAAAHDKETEAVKREPVTSGLSAVASLRNPPSLSVSIIESAVQIKQQVQLQMQQLQMHQHAQMHALQHFAAPGPSSSTFAAGPSSSIFAPSSSSSSSSASPAFLPLPPFLSPSFPGSTNAILGGKSGSSPSVAASAGSGKGLNHMSYDSSSSSLAGSLGEMNERIYYRRSWTPEQDRTLVNLVKVHGPTHWSRIAQYVPGKTGNQCSQRWHKALDPSIIKGKWSHEEDKQLTELVQKMGKQWKNVSYYVRGRTGKQCRDRYTARLNPTLQTGKWTAEEERCVVEAHLRLGNRWAAIQKLLPHRSWYTIKWKIESLAKASAARTIASK